MRHDCDSIQRVLRDLALKSRVNRFEEGGISWCRVSDNIDHRLVFTLFEVAWWAPRPMPMHGETGMIKFGMGSSDVHHNSVELRWGCGNAQDMFISLSVGSRKLVWRQRDASVFPHVSNVGVGRQDVSYLYLMLGHRAPPDTDDPRRLFHELALILTLWYYVIMLSEVTPQLRDMIIPGAQAGVLAAASVTNQRLGRESNLSRLPSHLIHEVLTLVNPTVGQLSKDVYDGAVTALRGPGGGSRSSGYIEGQRT